jgi:tRNA pseudouridine38-40 synthase
MKTFIRLSFFGASFYGTQKQKSFVTIQSVFENALSAIYGGPIKTTISSRLDRGVHALDFGLSFVPPDDRVSESHLRYYLRRTLSEDIVITDIRSVPDDFSARYSCDYKRYRYQIQNGTERHPLWNPLTYFPQNPLSEDKVQAALKLFEGTHDFRAFATPEKADEKTVLTIDAVSFAKKPDLILLRFQGHSFLRYQVRFMVGAVIRYATDKLTLDDIRALLDGKKDDYLKLKAEPQGLILETIHYPLFDGDGEKKTTVPSLLGE